MDLLRLFLYILIYTIYRPNNFVSFITTEKKITLFLLINSSTCSPASRHWASDVAVAPISQSTKFFLKKNVFFLTIFQVLIFISNRSLLTSTRTIPIPENIPLWKVKHSISHTSNAFSFTII